MGTNEVKGDEHNTEVVSTLCTGFRGINEKKIEIEDRIEFKRNKYSLQIESARKDLEIKIEVLNQIKGGNFNLKNLFGVPKND
ncbi:unnamed protein product [Colias eurytheme]|nr:unnamed protein product [Colias eurytheme]